MNLTQDITKSDWYIFAGFWILAFPLILMDYISHMSLGQSCLLFLVDFVLISLSSMITVYYLAPKYLPGKQFVSFLISLFFLLLLESFLYWVGTSLIWSCKFPSPFYQWLGDELVTNGQSLGILAGILLAKKYHETEQNILMLEAETKANELKALQSQVNPHFLFNNLNTLDELIDSNPLEAKQYVNRLAQLYRYLINTKDEEVVPVEEELKFVNNYIYLLQLRYGNSYQFQITDSLTEKQGYLIPPVTLQIIIENIVKHISGSVDVPLMTTIDVSSHGVVVKNAKRLKYSSQKEKGTGLTNLISRYKLLSDKKVVIEESEEDYKIIVPLIKLLNA